MATTSRCAAALVLVLFTLSAGNASASIFARTKLWPQTSPGHTDIPVCIEDDSNVSQKRGGIYAGFIYDRNPSLNDVVQRVRNALASSWESVSSVKFTDWRMCSQLSPDQQSAAMHFYISPDAANASSIGTDTRGTHHGVNFKPWGADATANICINYNWKTTHMQYDYSCVEQYSIHEVGHALGFLHEWYNPVTPSSCTQEKQQVQSGDWGPPLSGADASCLGGGETCYTVNAYTYDNRSIMTYDAECADVHGVRFGNTTLDNWDAVGAWYAYPTIPSGDSVGTGFGLLPGNSLYSANNQYRLTLQTDGNLVIYDASSNAVWNTGTYGQRVDFAIMQVDGNLVLYGAGAAVWASGTGSPHSRLFIQNDGTMAIHALNAKWSTKTSQNGLLVGDGARGVRAGEWLPSGTTLWSNSGLYGLAMQADGNLVLYRDGGALWSSGTQGQNGANATVQTDGNFVVYSAGGSARWASGTNGAAPDALLTVQDDGNAVLYSKSAVWWTLR